MKSHKKMENRRTMKNNETQNDTIPLDLLHIEEADETYASKVISG